MCNRSVSSNRSVSNGRIVSKVTSSVSDISIVSNVSIVDNVSIVRSLSSVSNVSIVCNSTKKNTVKLIYQTEEFVLLLKVSIYMPSLKVVKNVIERMKNLSTFLVSGLV